MVHYEMYEVLMRHYSILMMMDQLMMNLFCHDHLMLAKEIKNIDKDFLRKEKVTLFYLQNLVQDDQNQLDHELNSDEY